VKDGLRDLQTKEEESKEKEIIKRRYV